MCCGRAFSRCIEMLCRKLEGVATRAGIPEDECCGLEGILASLPPIARSQAQAILNGVQLSAADEFPAMAFAANYVLKLAREIWHSEPVAVTEKSYQPEPLERRP